MNEPNEQNTAKDAQQSAEMAGAQEYGIEHLMVDEKLLEEARKTSSYHYSNEQLEHKADRTDR